MDSYKIRFIEGVSLVLTVLLTHTLLSVPSSVLSKTGSASLLNIALISVIVMIFFAIVYKLFSLFPGNNIVDICGFLCGKVVKYIYGFAYILYILFLSAIVIRAFAEGLSLIFLSHIGLDFIMLLIVVSAVLLNYFGFKSVSRISILVIPFAVIGLVFIFFTSMDNFTLQRIFPILGYGAKETFISGLDNIYAFSGIYVLFFIFPLLTKISEYKKIGFMSIFIYALLLLLAISALLFSIPQISETSSPLSLYVLARQISLGEYIQSIDTMFLLIWVPLILSYLSVNMHFALSTFQQLTHIKHTSSMVYSFGSIIYVIALAIGNMADINFLDGPFYRYISISFVFILGFIILIFAGLKKLIIRLLKREEIKNV